MPRISENVRAPSEDFRQISEDLRTLPKMSEGITIRKDCRRLKAFAIVLKSKKKIIRNKSEMK